MPPNYATLCRVLAHALISGHPALDETKRRLSEALGAEWRWVNSLSARYLAAFAGRTRPRHREVVQFVGEDKAIRSAYARHRHELRVQNWVTRPQQMLPVAAAAHWNVPTIESAAELAKWLGISFAELQWFADLKGMESKRDAQRLRQYVYRVLVKRTGRVRLIEAPKPRLKTIQRQILTGILNGVPTHPAVHGFVAGRSIKSFASPHIGRHVVLRMDLQDFFPCITGRRVQALFRTMGYPESVADLLGGLCSNAAPRDAWHTNDITINSVHLREARALYARVHLPQGAPTSPALANLCAYRVDCRLSGLAQAAGARYTRYADDLAFSGGEEFSRCAERFSIHAAAILLEEGFAAHHRKTRVMRRGVRQYLAGIVANERLNVVRTDFDVLKATLTNCVRHGPESQNREGHSDFRAHLQGRVSFVEMINPAKAVRLRETFEQIRWADA